MPGDSESGGLARARRIHVTGASGAGVTTLGRALAQHYAVPHADTDDYFWLPTEPPFTTKRPVEDRLRLMREMFMPRAAWVLSGSLDGWGDDLVPLFDLVVFVATDRDERLARLMAREERRYGTEAVSPGGSRHADVTSFIEWAGNYEIGDRAGRNLPRHEAWLAALRCPVVRVDGTQPVDELVATVAAASASA